MEIYKNTQDITVITRLDNEKTILALETDYMQE